MSIRAINWCREVGRRIGIPPQERAVLMHLCCYHNEKSGECFPSYATLGDDTGYRRRRVIEAVQALEANGLIIIQKRRVAGHQGSNSFVLFGKPLDEKWNGSRVHHTTPCESAHGGTLPRVHTGAPDRDWSMMGRKAHPEALVSGGRA